MNGVIEIFRGMGRNFKVFAGMLFIYLKVTSNKSAPEVSIIHFYGQHLLSEDLYFIIL